MPRRLSPAEYAARTVEGAQGASQRYREGVEGVTSAPGEMAAANQAGYLGGVTQNVAKWARNVRVPLEQWKAQSAEVGSRNFAPGVADAAAKIERRAAEHLPTTYAIADEVRRMPGQNRAQRIQRSVAFQQRRGEAADRAHQGGR